jgi:pantothenate kinase type III
MLLALDIGNTNITAGVFDGEELAEQWRISTQRDRTADELAALLKVYSQHVIFNSPMFRAWPFPPSCPVSRRKPRN